jgi:hypothetical protein
MCMRFAFAAGGRSAGACYLGTYELMHSKGGGMI